MCLWWFKCEMARFAWQGFDTSSLNKFLPPQTGSKFLVLLYTTSALSNVHFSHSMYSKIMRIAWAIYEKCDKCDSCVSFEHHCTPLDVMHILCMMDWWPPTRASSHTVNQDTTCTMDFTSIMPQYIQPSRNALQRQTLLHLPSPSSHSSSCPLPSIPMSALIELHTWPFSLDNNQNHPLYDTNLHNN